MPPSVLGAVLGVANMVVIAFAIALDLGEGAEAFGTILVLGALPALIAGFVIGVVAHRTREWSVGARYAVLGIPALIVLMLCGAVMLPLAYYIPFACIPTLGAVRILEGATRVTTSLPPVIAWQDASLAREGSAVTRLDPVALGMMLGLANLILIAFGMNGMTHPYQHGMHHHGTDLCFHGHVGHSVGLGVFTIGLLPAVITGAVVGRMAHRCRNWPVWSRRLVVVALPFAVVVLLGVMFSAHAFVLPALAPTAAAALWLERATRDRTLPAARTL